MRYSQLMHATMIVTGIAGGVSLILAWVTSSGTTVLGYNAQFFYTNAFNLQIVAISAGICTLVRRGMEKENPGLYI